MEGKPIKFKEVIMMKNFIIGVAQIAGGLIVGDLIGKGANKAAKVVSKQINKVKLSKKG